MVKAKALASSLPKLTVLNSPRRHVCTQRNLGAKHARADIFIFMDADNRLPTYFLQGVKYRLESDTVDIASFWMKPDKSTSSTELISLGINLGTEIQNSLKPRFMLEAMIVVYRSVFFKIGGFDESVNYAEGVDFISHANMYRSRIKTFRDPTYSYSFRRFRKFGNLKILRNTAKLGISQLFDQDYKNVKASSLYPMLGGNYFTRPRKAKSQFLRNIAKLLKDF